MCHLSGQCPAVERERSDMKMRAAQPPADLSHRSRLSPSNSPLYEIHLTSFPLPTLLHVFHRFDLLMFLSLFYDFSFYILILFFFSLLHTKPTVFLLLQISTQTSFTQCNIVRAEIKCATDLSISTKF